MHSFACTPIYNYENVQSCRRGDIHIVLEHICWLTPVTTPEQLLPQERLKVCTCIHVLACSCTCTLYMYIPGRAGRGGWANNGYGPSRACAMPLVTTWHFRLTRQLLDACRSVLWYILPLVLVYLSSMHVSLETEDTGENCLLLPILAHIL